MRFAQRGPRGRVRWFPLNSSQLHFYTLLGPVSTRPPWWQHRLNNILLRYVSKINENQTDSMIALTELWLWSPHWCLGGSCFMSCTCRTVQRSQHRCNSECISCSVAASGYRIRRVGYIYFLLISPVSMRYGPPCY